MNKIKLTQGKEAIVDFEDYEYLTQFKWFAWRESSTGDFYAARNLYDATTKKQKMIQMHRVLLGVTDPKIKVDHRDHNTLNNCRSNIRIASNSESGANQRKGKRNKSGFKGVSRSGGKWMASIQWKKKWFYIGTFPTPDLAHEAYKIKALELHGEFACYE